ncbi:MAG: flagellar basal body P-ring formation protein FlgA [Cryobacterium sp.]|nr:flagellar basal body P-ring formation protein FlgA [Oligoflexia bacterium]
MIKLTGVPLKKLMIKFAAGFGIGLALSSFGMAAENLSKNNEKNIEPALRLEIGKKFPRANIEFLNGSTFPVAHEGATLLVIRILSESGTGTAEYSASYSDGSSALGQAHFSASVPTYVASRRIRPGDRLQKEDFQIQSINVAQGLAYQYRGVMFGANESIEGLQARQTILEGQYPLTSGVERVPDIRRGDTVQVKIQSGEVSLTTMAIVQEPGYRDQNVRVLTQKTKKELVGQLREGNLVEVTL